MWYKILISTIIIALVAIFQITLLGSFGDYLSSFNLLLAVLVLLLFLIDFKWIMYFTITAGLILDIYSSLPFGIFMVSMFLAITVSNFLLLNFFTNRSFYAVASVGLMAILSFNCVFLGVSGLTYVLGVSDFYIDKNYWLRLLFQIINILIILVGLFFIINLSSRRFKPNFVRS
ncbi:hypothetical protein GW933_01310 [Candidatus Falkowbacteria bacterium]|uniref:Rod shape-determining protein MreD n=1 Tax=Candidatus Buchananbacteria bacterium CG10_big_fil_rev_8_21_14_0_10_33_19 TaxID=1974525 RepID=A0A2H0W3F3_9BACT|nr:hypothetical protein [Candidatus Falkowbacteria bacterium]PIS05892.1 MAG: hypothetical protein COT80_03940 [Candidatus Buchananbacteria bacterium CG10_big_fil_rev_8_21_14_0_10_33_19]